MCCHSRNVQGLNSENRLHWVRDVIFDEDRCRIRRGTGAQVMASLRNLAISLLRMAGAESIAPAALRLCTRSVSVPFRLSAWRDLDGTLAAALPWLTS